MTYQIIYYCTGGNFKEVAEFSSLKRAKIYANDESVRINAIRHTVSKSNNTIGKYVWCHKKGEYSIL